MNICTYDIVDRKLKSSKTTIKVGVDNQSVSIAIEGYSPKYKEGGEVIVIEVIDGIAYLYVFNNVNTTDPLIISLEKAKEELYQGDK